MSNDSNIVSKKLLYNAVYDQFSVSRKESAELVNLVLDEISQTLASGEDVKLAKFGTFSIKERAARLGRNIRTGEIVNIEPCRALKFKPSSVLLERVNSNLVVESD